MVQAGRRREICDGHDDGSPPFFAIAPLVRVVPRFFDDEVGIAGKADDDADRFPNISSSFINNRDEEDMAVYSHPVSQHRFPPSLFPAAAAHSDLSEVIVTCC